MLMVDSFFCLFIRSIFGQMYCLSAWSCNKGKKTTAPKPKRLEPARCESERQTLTDTSVYSWAARQNRCQTPPCTLQAPSSRDFTEQKNHQAEASQYWPWSLPSVGESSCRRKNLTSCFRGPHFCRCSYIMCSKGIARSKETRTLTKRLISSNDLF